MKKGQEEGKRETHLPRPIPIQCQRKHADPSTGECAQDGVNVRPFIRRVETDTTDGGCERKGDVISSLERMQRTDDKSAREGRKRTRRERTA